VAQFVERRLTEEQSNLESLATSSLMSLSQAADPSGLDLSSGLRQDNIVFRPLEFIVTDCLIKADEPNSARMLPHMVCQ